MEHVNDPNVVSEAKESTGESASKLVALPVELLVHIFGFLGGIRDLMKMRYISRKMRRVSETPSLWRTFTWSQFDSTEERYLRSVLKSCGGNIYRLSFPDHVMPSKLTSMLRHCRNLVQLSIPTSKLNYGQLATAIEPMKNLERLDVSWNESIN